MNNENCLPRRPLKPTAYIPKVFECEVPDLSMCSDFSDEETLDASGQTRQFGERNVDFQTKSSHASEISPKNKIVQPDNKLSSVRNKDFSFANVNTNCSKFQELDMPYSLPREASSSPKNEVVQSECNDNALPVNFTNFSATKANSTRPKFQDSDIHIANPKLVKNALKICGKPLQNNQSLQHKNEKSTKSLGNLSNRSINTRMEMNEYLHSQKFVKKQVKCICCPESQILQNAGILVEPSPNCSSPSYGPCGGEAKQMLNTAQRVPVFANDTIFAVPFCHNVIDASRLTMASDKINRNQMCEHALSMQSVRENMSPCEPSSSILYQSPKEKAIGNNDITLVSQSEDKPPMTYSSNRDCNNKDADLFLKHIKSQDEKLTVIQKQLSLLLEKNRKHSDTKLLGRIKMAGQHDNEMNASISNSDIVLDFLKGGGKDESSYDPRVCSLLISQHEQIQQLSQQMAILMKEQNREEPNSSNKESPMPDKNKTPSSRNTPGSCKDNIVYEMDCTKTCSTGTMTSFVLVDKKEVYDSYSKQSTGQCCKCGDKPVKKITTTQIIVATGKTHSEKSNKKTSRKSDRSHQKLDGMCHEKSLCKSDSSKSDFSIENEDCSSSACSKNSISSNYSANNSRPSPSNRRVSGEFYEKVMGNMDKIISKQQTKSNRSPAVSTAIKSVSPVSRRSSKLEIEKKTSKQQECSFSTLPNHVSEEKISSKDMSMEFQKLTAKYLNKDDILEVQESCTLSTNFSNATLEYLETHGLLPKKSISHHKKLTKNKNL